VPVQANEIITSTLANGWTLYEVVNEEFSIALPPEWLPIDLNPNALGDALKAVGEQNPELKRLFSNENLRNLAASGVKLYALNLKPETLLYDIPISMNVIKIDVGFKLPLDTYVPLVLRQLQAVADPQVPITHHRVTLSGIEAEEFKYSMSINNARGQPVKGQVIQYLIPVGTIQYTISLIAPGELAEEYMSTLEQIGQSFQLSD